MKNKIKTCMICEQRKTKEKFKKGCEYCLHCEIKSEGNLFIFNRADQAIDIASPEEADLLLKNEWVKYTKKVFIALDEQKYKKEIKFKKNNLKDVPEKIIAVGKYNEKRNAITVSLANHLVEEGAAVWENEKIIYLFSGKELQEYVLKRDNYRCFYCKEVADRITFLLPRSDGGVLSPKNSISCCEVCKEIHGEDMFFHRWLNIPVVKNKKTNNDVFFITDIREQSTFMIKKEIAEQLIKEEMAEVIGENKIKLLYSRKSFREHLLKRDKETCYYCGKHGVTIEHKKPQVKGGMTTPKNCVLACNKCNELKGDIDAEEFLKKARCK